MNLNDLDLRLLRSFLIVEAGAYNLTQDVASCFVRFGAGRAQTWLMVRLPAPTMPTAPTPIGERSNSTEGHS